MDTDAAPSQAVAGRKYGNNKRESRAPDYRPIPLALPYLIAFIFYVCMLVVAIEYSFHLLPTSEDRRDIHPVNFLGRQPYTSTPLKEASSATPTKASIVKKTPTPETINIPRFRRQSFSSGTNWTYRNATNTTAETPSTITPVAVSYRTARPRRASDQISLIPRVQQASHYGKPAGEEQILFITDLITDEPGAIKGLSLIAKYYHRSAADSLIKEGKTFVEDDGLRWRTHLCMIQCDGPILVFQTDYCWIEWLINQQVFAEWLVDGTLSTLIEVPMPGGEVCEMPSTTKKPTVASAVITYGAMIDGTSTTITATTRFLVTPTGDMIGKSTYPPSIRLSMIHTTMIIRDSEGRPTIMITTDLPLIDAVATLTNSNGEPTATITTQVAITPDTVTMTDSNGVPTATITVPSPRTSDDWLKALGRPKHDATTWTELILGSFLPLFLAMPIFLLAQEFKSTLHNLIPFSFLTRSKGTPASASICLHTDGIFGFLESLRLLFHYHEPIAIIGDLLVMLSSVIVSLSSEAVGIKVFGNCKADNFRGCYMRLAIFTTPSRITEALLILTLIVLIAIGILMRKWRSGVTALTAKRSIFSIIHLLASDETRNVLQGLRPNSDHGNIKRSEMIRQLDKYNFRLKRLEDVQSGSDYGYYIETTTARNTSEESAVSSKPATTFQRKQRWKGPRGISLGQGVFLMILCGSFILIMYYEITQLDTPFERFMDSQSFGVEGLFTALGLIISLFWSSYYSSK
jgi:hypothetical protein